MRGGIVVTVEADQFRVESRLAAGQVCCPSCPGTLRPWGWARPRGVRGIAGVLRPRRARCPGCLVTHVLLPVTVLARRAYAVEVIGGQRIVSAEAARLAAGVAPALAELVSPGRTRIAVSNRPDCGTVDEEQPNASEQVRGHDAVAPHLPVHGRARDPEVLGGPLDVRVPV